MAVYEFLFQHPPSPRTIQHIRHAIELGRNKIMRQHSGSDSYWAGYIAAQRDLMAELKDIEEELK